MTQSREVHKTTCCYCGVGCGMDVHVDHHDRIQVRGDATHPVNRGMLCSKGRYLHHVVQNRSERILFPELRRHRDADRERVDWDTALSHAADRFQSIIDAHGPEAVGFYVSGQLLTEEYYVANKLMKGFIGSNNIDTNSRLCMSSASMGYKQTVGDDTPPISYDDIEQCRCFFIAGANPAWCHPILFRRLEQHKAENPDVKVIVADPRRTQTCALADLHLPVKPGTDVSLFNAIARCLLDRDLIDRDFVERHTDGFAELEAHLRTVDVEAAARRCAVSADAIRRAAGWIGNAETFITMWAMGLNQSADGTQKNLALLNLSLLTGQIGKPGAGPFSLTGQPNAMGGREVGGMATLLAAHHDLTNPDDRAHVADFWGVDRIAPEPGLTATELFDALRSGALKAVWILCTNPAVSLPDLNAVEEAFDRADFVVVQDISHRSETTRYADLLLPAAGWLEKEGTMTNSERRISYLPKVIDPPGEARPDAEILCDFARRMGWSAAFDYDGAADIFSEYARLTRGTPIDITGLSHERLRTEGTVQWPCPAGDHPGTKRLFTDRTFHTASGHARLHPVRPSSRDVDVSEAYPLTLTTGRVRDQWHTRTKTGTVHRLNRHTPLPYLEVHPRDADRYGLQDDAPVRITSRHGTMQTRVDVTETVPPGTVFLPMHWDRAVDTEADGRANTLTSARVDPDSKQPDYKFTAVRLEPVEKPAETVVVVGAGAAGRAFVEAYGERETADEIHVFGREPLPFYNRILLPDYVTGERTWDALCRPLDGTDGRPNVHLHHGVEITAIDRAAQHVVDDSGRRHGYDKLLLCTGSRAFVPPGIPMERDGVFSLRTRHDADRIKEHLTPDMHVLIVGGGLLGLEAAAALEHAGVACTVIEMADRLMHRQLDATASAILREELEARGIHVCCGDLATEYLEAEGAISGVRTREGRHIACDALLVAVGTRPNVELADEAGLEIDRGVVVNAHLQTSDPAIYAAGEIAAYDGMRYGITPAAQEQARVAAAHMNGDVWARYDGSVLFNILKIHGLDVCAMGQTTIPDTDDADAYEEIVLLDRRQRYYKKCVIQHGRLVGAILVGDTTEMTEFREMIASGLELEDRRSDLLRPGTGNAPPEPPRGELVCVCNNVGTDNLRDLIADGCTDFSTLCQTSRAGTGCGSCRPEVRTLLKEQLAPA